MNKVILLGNLGSDAELRMSQSGVGVLKMSLATNERVKKGDNWEDHTEWHRVVTFGRRAEGLAKCLSKGSSVCVLGKLRTSSYETQDGVRRYSTEIIADDIELVGGRRERRDESHDVAGETYTAPGVDDDIPF